MGMILQMRRAAPDVLAELETGQLPALEFVYPMESDDAAYRDGSILNIDKSWHAIHFLLARVKKGAAQRAIHTITARFVWNTKLPSGFLLAGTEVGDDLGYGPVRILPPSQILEVSEFLAVLPDDFVESRLNFGSLRRAGVYPSIWDRKDPDHLEYVSSHFQSLRKFISTAANRAEGVAQVIA